MVVVFRSLQGKLMAGLTLVALVPVLLLGGLGLVSVRGLSAVARDRARAAVDQELRQKLLSLAQEKARADDALLEGVRAQAVSLSRYVAWYYDHPENVPEPGYLKGGSSLELTSQGHRVNRDTTPVGVFLSRLAALDDAVWREVGTLSFADPLMVAIHRSTAGASRVWVTSATRIVRIYPNVGLGHEGSPVGPDYDLTDDEPFQAAAPGRNPDGLPVWTSPHLDPVTGGLMMSAVAPIHDSGGRFRAVTGIDVTLGDIVGAIQQAQAPPIRYAVLLDREARVISASGEAWSDLGLPPYPGQRPGRAVSVALQTSSQEGVRTLASRVRDAPAAGLIPFEAEDGRRYASFAPLPATGWVLLLVARAEDVDGAPAAVEAGILRIETLYVMGTVFGAFLVIVLVWALASRTATGLTRPVGHLLEGTRRLSKDLSFRMESDLGSDELGQLAGAFNTMAASIERSQDEAIRSARLVVEERTRMAREIHDTIAQGLTGTVIQLEAAEESVDEPERSLRHVRNARDLARESLQEARRSVWNLRPAATSSDGLARALQSLVDSISREGIAAAVEVDNYLDLSPDTEDTLFRVCQEALANVRKHSGADRVAVTLQSTEGGVSLRIADDGRGFDPSSLRGPHQEGGFGLWSMRGRLERVGGTLAVESTPGGGTVITARIPQAGGI